MGLTTIWEPTRGALRDPGLWCGTASQFEGRKREFVVAETWYCKSLSISEKRGIEHTAAATYGQLGILATLQERYEQAALSYVRSISAFLKTNDEHGAAQTAHNFRLAFDAANPASREPMRQTWQAANLGELPAEAT